MNGKRDTMRQATRRPLPAILLGLGLMVLGQTAAAAAEDGSAVLDALTPDRRVAVGLERLGFCLGAAALDQQPGQNALIAPLGAARVLDLIASGSPLPVRQAVANALGWPGFLAGSIAFQVTADAAIAQAAAQEDIALRLATGVWHSPDRKPRTIFARAAGDGLQQLDFAAEDALATVNDWVSQQTNGQIVTVLAEIPADTAMLITDALAFAGAWSQPFDPAQTRTATFADRSPMTAHVAMMRAPRLTAAHASSDMGDMVVLPFGDGTFEAVLALPGPAGLRGFSRAACHETGGIATPDAETGLRPVDLAMPRFQIAGSVEIDGLMRAAEMSAALDHPLAGSAMTVPPTRPGQLYQHVALTVDEAGAKVAAATIAIGTRAAVEPVRMVLDRPFAILIRQRGSGLPIVLGLINRPTPVEGDAAAPAATNTD